MAKLRVPVGILISSDGPYSVVSKSMLCGALLGIAEARGEHGELALDQFFTMRPLLDWARYRTPIRNLFLCGSGTHPGGCVSGFPGRRAADAVLRDLGATLPHPM